ncbi:MAG TPA: CBS domain-containing protein [Polyangiaceae bacterium]|nr:CBS domain-containing protein [Polyangiaceae bacterium]
MLRPYRFMPPEHPERPQELPVRSLEVFERDGRSARALRVFCPPRHASVAARTCTACPFAQTVSETTVTCAPPALPGGREAAPDNPLFLGPDALALRTPVGAVCALRSVAVRVDVPVARARRLLDRDPFVVVLTEDDRVRGVLSAAEPSDELIALDEIDGRTPALPESAPLIEAIELMLHGHVRLVSVTGENHHFLGLVADLDVLRWAARHNLPPDSKPR